jgi:ActR/RegA family two-component response regulator
LADRPTLLVVEDDENFLALLESAFAPTYDIVRATSAAAALDSVREKADLIDVIVLDMWLPRDEGGAPVRNIGLEVLLVGKGRPTHPGLAPEIQVVVITGHPDLQNAIESQRLGSFRYIVKGSPNMIDDLKRDVEAARAETQGRRIHKAIMEGGRLDLLEPLPLRPAAPANEPSQAVSEITHAAVAVAHASRGPSPNLHLVADLLRQIRQLADEALQSMETEDSESTTGR